MKHIPVPVALYRRILAAMGHHGFGGHHGGYTRITCEQCGAYVFSNEGKKGIRHRDNCIVLELRSLQRKSR